MTGTVAQVDSDESFFSFPVDGAIAQVFVFSYLSCVHEEGWGDDCGLRVVTWVQGAGAPPPRPGQGTSGSVKPPLLPHSLWPLALLSLTGTPEAPAPTLRLPLTLHRVRVVAAPNSSLAGATAQPWQPGTRAVCTVPVLPAPPPLRVECTCPHRYHRVQC